MWGEREAVFRQVVFAQFARHEVSGDFTVGRQRKSAELNYLGPSLI